MKIADLITQINYELVNSTGEFSSEEILAYINKAYQLIYSVLVGRHEELALTGIGSFSTASGVQDYDLTTVSTPITDLWTPGYVWISGYPPMEQDEKSKRFSARNDKELGNESGEMPSSYCLLGNVIWFTQIPGDIYTVNLEYYPSYSMITDTNASTPFNGIFDYYAAEIAIMIAKNRNDMGSKIDAALLQLAQDTVDRVLMSRRNKDIKISINSTLYNYSRRNRLL